MNYLDWIIKIAAVIGALGVIYGVCLKVCKKIFKPLIDAFEELKAHSHENYMGILRLTIMSNEMPIGERIVAGHKYLSEGGNGEVKSFLKSEFNIEETIETAEHYKK